MFETGLEEPRGRSVAGGLEAEPASRGRFLRATGGAGGAAALAVLLAACGATKHKLTPGGSNPNTGAGLGTDMFGKGDLGIVNYALTLEYLESDFYSKAIESGQLSGEALTLARAFGADEAHHVKTLEAAVSALGGTPAKKPATRFQLTDQASILQVASSFEGLGAAAYLGQAERIQSKEILATALAIHSVEARHSAALNALVGLDIAPDGAFAKPASAPDVAIKIQPFVTSS